MRKFRFRLQGLEDIKGMELDNLKQQLAVARKELLRTEQQLMDTREALNNTYNEIADLRARQTDPVILLSLESYTGVLRQQISARAAAVAQQKKELAEAQSMLTAKHKEKKVLEKFRERQYDKYSQYVDRETQKELDETAKNLHSQNDGAASLI